jgi:hypothetical protein
MRKEENNKIFPHIEKIDSADEQVWTGQIWIWLWNGVFLFRPNWTFLQWGAVVVWFHR